MKFLLITDAPTLIKDGQYVAYAPYVNEMDLWMKYTETTILSPNKYTKPLLVKPFKNKLVLKPIEPLIFNSFLNTCKSLLFLPTLFFKIFSEIKKSEHLHLRCPGNIGLLSCFIQILFPSKLKTVKYAGNWDPNSKQPFSYRLQKKILSNTFLTKNCKVLVYGKWEDQSKNIIPFFTASYREEEIEKIPDKPFNGIIRFLFVGTFSEGKQPFVSVKTTEELKKYGLNVRLDMYGDGALFDNVLSYIKENALEENIFLHGNQPKEIVKKAFQNSHFLVFISKSEGWPKVVAEAMFWGCLPISTKVSCVPYMLDEGERGVIVKSNISYKEISKLVLQLVQNEVSYKEMIQKARNWSQKFTLDTFEESIKKFL